MAGAILEPRPSQWVEPKSGALSGPAANYLDLVLLPRIQQNTTAAAGVAVPVSKLGQSAAIGATVLVGAANAASYRATLYAQLVQAATVSSAISLSITSTYNGQTITQTLTAATGNTLTTVCAGVLAIRADAGSVISFSTTYASVGATVMKYDLYVSLEAL